jgi:hypothetical protein
MQFKSNRKIGITMHDEALRKHLRLLGLEHNISLVNVEDTACIKSKVHLDSLYTHTHTPFNTGHHARYFMK